MNVVPNFKIFGNQVLPIEIKNVQKLIIEIDEMIENETYHVRKIDCIKNYVDFLFEKSGGERGDSINVFLTQYERGILKGIGRGEILPTLIWRVRSLEEFVQIMLHERNFNIGQYCQQKID